MSKALRVRDRGTVAQRHLADALLERPGDFVVVDRGLLRSVVFSCPDGCGDILTINLDPRSGKAWRFYRRKNQVSLFPSVWRDTGCESHFIVWHHTIIWCDIPERNNKVVLEDESTLRGRVVSICTDNWQHFTELAEILDEVPWDVNRVCLDLARYSGKIVAGTQKLQGCFKLAGK